LTETDFTEQEPPQKPLCLFCRKPSVDKNLAGTCSDYCFKQEYATLLQCMITKPRKVVDKDGKPVSYRGRGFIGDV